MARTSDVNTQAVQRKPTLTTSQNVKPNHTKHRRNASTSSNSSKPEAHSNVFMKKFQKLPASTQALLKRITFGTILLSYFGFIIYGGPIVIIATVLALQIKSFHEIITIAYRKYDISDMPEFQYISIYFVLCSNSFFGVENTRDYFEIHLNRMPMFRDFLGYHRFTSFCMYFCGVIWFVLTLKKKVYRKQFSLLAWTHILIIVLVVQSQLIVKSIFQGMIWFVLCITTVTCNDIMAYFCGKFFGKTPLIHLSPKKTWEGFIGAAILTVLISCLVAHFACAFEYFVCPIVYEEINGEIIQLTHCEPDEMFRLSSYTSWNIKTYPFVIHSFFLAIFGSLVAPFGGFFASGFKRAMKVKDFGDTIPGHGGITDRFDCQLVMVTFMHVYISSFAGSISSEKSNTNKLFERIMDMRPEEQLEIFTKLREVLAL